MLMVILKLLEMYLSKVAIMILKPPQISLLNGKDTITLKLVGYIFVKNLESEEGLSIQESYGYKLTIFTDSGLFKLNSENKNRVKT